jgi:hypothetical protein
MRFSLSTPDWNKVFKDNFRKYSVPTGAGDDDKTTVKVPVFERGNLEAALHWRKQFQDLIELKQLNVDAKFTNARILLTGAAREKWQQARDDAVGAQGNLTEARFNRTMTSFLQKCGATTETAEDLRDFLMNAKKPPNMNFEDFKQRIEELNDYLPYLPAPLNERLSDDQLFVTLKKSVPAWQKKYIDSNARRNIDNVNDLADYYNNLETQEKKEQRNREGRDKQQRSGQRQGRDSRQRRSNESHYIDRSQGNPDRRAGGNDRRDTRGNSYQQQGSQNRYGSSDRNNSNSNRSNDRQGQQNRNGQNRNGQSRYNTRYQERQHRQQNENHHIDDDNSSNNDDRSELDDTYHSETEYERDSESVEDNEVYFTEKDFQPPAGIIYDEVPASDGEEYETDDDSVPPLERITEYESDDDSVPTLKPLPDYESDDDDDSIVEHLSSLAPSPIVDKHNTRELLVTDTATIQVQPIPKQEIDYRPEIVIAIPRDPQGRNSVFLRALIDSGSNKSHGKLDKMPKWIREQAIPTGRPSPLHRMGK